MVIAVIVLSVLLVIACGSWAAEWFRGKMLIAWLAMNGVRLPDEDQWRKCARIAKRCIFPRKK